MFRVLFWFWQSHSGKFYFLVFGGSCEGSTGIKPCIFPTW